MSALEREMALHLRAAGIQAEREFRFHPVRRWRFDFALPDEKLAIECEGGHWTGGRHVRGKGFEADCEKYNTAALMGWTVLRFTGKEIKSGQALQMIESALNPNTPEALRAAGLL